ncbi:UPF0102 protein [Youhaiella tibetensis]|uniref:UPF0102 protein FNA67_21275 n=1 Tax=Paradevosia tibetensis TaxID=1447062 RepID=A0A5B9DSY0_9HYPH|nr:YraN family protein [Youhaiella tibetensis]AKR57613.1 hypothetical protein XM25_17865 [Devosia sp. H5989]QEE22540.1 YraN family protein [Youhaiella tibetensis]GGF41347.1 UPF0102 protein [Youhaiella tibetensis]
MPPSLSRQRAERAGRRAEFWAAWFLRLKLYSIRAQRYRTPVGEIDLVASRFGVTVFVEVKARARRGHELEALEAVDQRRISRAADYFLTRHPALADSPLRFDVVFLAPFMWPRHLVNAFDAL